MAPEYGSSLYWEERFKSDPSAFEWLVKPDYFHEPVMTALQSSPVKQPKVLHIGCGSSELSYHLRYLVDHPSQVHNVDFSGEAVAIGRKHDDEKAPMHWKAVDLLDHEHIHGLRGDISNEKLFGLVVDKGTADSVACGYPRSISAHHFELVRTITEQKTSDSNGENGTMSSKLSPETMLALHLAHLTQAGSHWVCVSFSASRFDFLHELHTVQSPGDGKAISFRVSELWRLEKRVPIEVEQDVKNERDHPVHRPKIEYRLYILIRK
ncbi:MAG: hypothetical protein Q9162_002749 [Coniocarpon cinnabarinum]